ncbi:MAG: UvrB/UvrC motif-containing protein [Planctomycetes bacterium]|nr:UvrB/UvrC motif-containing protein [Planctomycetota bacterium]MBU1517601.1 UvrB/UvrC motif-containing protein [Planctomycetota bacterium]MBU2457135.1 UvrB/UvrC motif-containing protein [Planctomycetota bacterium]MBU2597474.1 UvrB/UvrC motif-containing protein [Planctomycetota bacterium]
MQCEICKTRTATVHLTEIINGQRSESHLCQNCAQKEGVTIKSQLSLNELLSSLIAAHQQTDEGGGSEKSHKVCPECGITMEQFRKQALLGCPKDYDVFESDLKEVIEKTQDNNLTHKGKVPAQTRNSSNARPENQDKIEELQKQLSQAVEKEDYELAAKIRDQLKELQ